MEKWLLNFLEILSLPTHASIPFNLFPYHHVYFFFLLFLLDYMTLGEAPYHCNSGNLRIVGANAGMIFTLIYHQYKHV